MDLNSKIFIAGHRGLVGSAITRHLKANGFNNLILKTHKELDLTHSDTVKAFFQKEKPEYVFLAAAKVGGIHANSVYPADFIFNNLMIQSNVIHSAFESAVKKLLFLGSSCIYPRDCPQPIKEEYLLSDYLEETNEAYAIAKIAGIKMCQSYNRQYGTNFISAMPTNLYGINDNFHSEDSHVIPALIRRFHQVKTDQAESITVWGTGSPKREFLFADDLAEACVFLMRAYSESDLINIGVGQDMTILELANIIKETVGYEVELIFDSTKPDGTPQKVLDVTKINQLGWTAKTDIRQGLMKTYQWFVNNIIN